VTSIGGLGSPVIFLASFLLSLLVLAYRWPTFPRVRAAVDAVRTRLTGRTDWGWVRLWHLLVPLAVITAANIYWNVTTLTCEDSFAILASGQAALHGHNPFVIDYCGGTQAQIPYGLAEVALNSLGATSGSILGMYLVWQLLALAVVPLVWAVSGSDRRYVSILVATSVLYLPNIATNIGVENAIVPVAVLLMLYALTVAPRGRSILLQGVAAFLSTARFPALFPLLGSSAPRKRGKWAQATLVLGVFLASMGVAYALWGWDAIQVVYLGQFSRVPAESLNLFALLLVEGWFHPSLASAVVQGVGLLALVLWVNARGYSAIAASAIPLLGVMLLSQYLSFHFVLWIVPVLLLGGTTPALLLGYGALAYLDETFVLWPLGYDRGIWWPYELLGAVLTVLLLIVLVRTIRDEEARLHRVGKDDNLPSA
jgi:hypothetical protein